MANFNSLKNITMVSGPSAESPTIVGNVPAPGTAIAITSGNQYLSVGDTLTVVSPGTGGTATYAAGTQLTVTHVNAGGTGIGVTPAGGHTANGATFTINGWDTDGFLSFGNISSKESLDIQKNSRETTNDVTNGVPVGPGGIIPLPALSTYASPDNVELEVILDAVYTAAGVASPNTVFQLLGGNGGTGSTQVPLANLKQGDVFYTPRTTQLYYTSGTANLTDLSLKNVSGATAIAFFRTTGASY